MSAEDCGHFGHGVEQIFIAGRRRTKALRQRIQQKTEGALAVGGAYGQVTAGELRIEIEQIAVVGEDPVAAPEFALEGVGVLQTDIALRGLADMRHHIHGLNRVVLHQSGQR